MRNYFFPPHNIYTVFSYSSLLSSGDVVDSLTVSDSSVDEAVEDEEEEEEEVNDDSVVLLVLLVSSELSELPVLSAGSVELDDSVVVVVEVSDEDSVVDAVVDDGEVDSLVDDDVDSLDDVDVVSLDDSLVLDSVVVELVVELSVVLLDGFVVVVVLDSMVVNGLDPIYR